MSLRRRLLGEIARVAAWTVTAAIRSLTGERELAVGIVACLQTHGSRANWHPHLHLMRYVLESAGDREGEVPLDDELDFVRSFVALEQLRLGPRLRVEECVEEEALECGIPALTLQPLVENAIRHGIAPRTAGGVLRIAAALDGETLVVTIADDGPGGVPSAAIRAGGIGLRTVQQRLAARYGAAARCDVISAPNEGWALHVRIPARLAMVRRPHPPAVVAPAVVAPLVVTSA